MTRDPPRRPRSAQLTGSDTEFAGWQRFYGRLATLAEDLAPTLAEPLLSAAELTARLRDPELWHDLRERPLADVVADHLRDDVVRGVALTDGLIGTFADVHAADGLAGRCFLYHLVGNGTGPAGGCRSAAWARSPAPWRPPPAAAARSWSPGRPSPRWTRAPDGVTVHWTDDDGTEQAGRRRPRRQRCGARPCWPS